VATRITEPVALSTVAECRGLSVRVDGPDGAPDAGLITWLQPGSANRVTVDGNHLLYLRAVGQCTDRLAYMVVEPPHEDRAQGLSGDAEQPFRKAEGGIVTHADTPGQAEVRILLSCPLTASCASDPEVLATLTLDIVAPLGSGQTLSPSSALERTAPPESLHGAGGEPSTPPTAPG
jgi:hypothetical protein